jgi:hypothetical protein
MKINKNSFGNSELSVSRFLININYQSKRLKSFYGIISDFKISQIYFSLISSKLCLFLKIDQKHYHFIYKRHLKSWINKYKSIISFLTHYSIDNKIYDQN